MAIKASGAFLKMSEINAEFLLGNSTSAYRGVTWYVDNAVTTGTFATTSLKFSDFYSKRKTDPAGAGSTTYTASGSFTVPLFRNNLIVDAWGGGGGGDSGGGGLGGDTSVTVSTGTLNAGGGKGGGGGGRRSTGPGGGGGSATGGDINQPGSAGGAGASNAGGNAGGIDYGGGAGGIAGATGTACGGNDGLPGNAPGGGGGGVYGRDCSKDPGWSYSGGGGGGGFVRKTLSPAQAPYQSVITFTVGAGSTGAAQSVGAIGRVKMTWS